MGRIPSFVAAALAALIAGCANLPSLEGRTVTSALADTDGTRLGRAVAPHVAANPGKTGVHAFDEPHAAFAARVLLAGAAERTLDAQYYTWSGDQVGFLLFEALWQAAERGVRVRLLLDDNGTVGLDPVIATLDAHPNIEVRLYNPFVDRNSRTLDFATDFRRLNRRMHNKSFTADNQVSVVGGRNIGNQYFGAGNELVFADVDVVAVGPVVRDVSKEFDVYWNSASAYPAESFVGKPAPDAVATLEAMFATTRADPVSVDYLVKVQAEPLVRGMIDGNVALEWTRVRLVNDDPVKTLDTMGRKDVLLFTELARIVGQPEKTLDLVSPYFVPGDQGAANLVAMAARGVNIRILTNSLASTDEAAVHAGYVKHREELLRAGIWLYELKPTAAKASGRNRIRFGSGSTSALHAKSFVVDRQRYFAGSFNFDQRSALLNTEMGFVIDSSKVGRDMTAIFDVDVPLAAYEVRIAPDGRSLEWIERTDSGEVRHDTEPGTSWFQRSTIDFLSIFPIDWML